MKKIFINLFLIFSLIVSSTNTTYATSSLDITATVDVPASCSATDTNSVSHDYPQGNSYLAICALEAALGNGSVSSVQLSNQYPSMGLFITAINNVVANPNSQYWAILQNGNLAQLGISSLPVAAGDVLLLQLHDFSDNNLGDQLTINIHSLLSNVPSPSPASGGGHSGGGGQYISIFTPKPVFNFEKAFGFLVAQQKEDGSFGENLYTDWAMLALASGNYQEQISKSVKYFGEIKIENSLLTDYERHAMALMALGLNPYNINGENYIEKITAQFDGKQFGNANEDNDDIFALIVLQNAGYKQNEKMINDDINFILSKQKENGSWDESVDMTGAFMEALSVFKDDEQINAALVKAKEFLKQSQKDNGGWNNNVSSTAWAIEGILAMNEKLEDWRKSENTPLDYLATTQDTDGGIKGKNIKNRIWETAYVVSSLSNKTWNQIMQKFKKPAASVVAVVQKKSASKMTTTKRSSNLKLKNLANQNTASVINAATPDITIAKTETQRKNWFRRMLESIFGF